MSVQATRLIYERCPADGPARQVLYGVAFFASVETGRSWPSDAALQQFACVGKRHLHRLLRGLESEGYLHRCERREGEGRRVYTLNPAGGHQLALDLAEGAPRCHLSAEGKGDIPGPEGDTHARAGTEGIKGKTPPQPPKGGAAHSPDLLGRLPTGHAPARPRRRSRHGGRPPLVAVACPLPGLDGSDHGELSERWGELSERWGEAIGQRNFEIWLAGAHLHATEPVLQLAVGEALAGWVAGRLGPVLAQSAGVPLEVVACRS